MPVRKSVVGVPLVMFAATMWGAAGLFVRHLVGVEITSIQLVYYANGIGFVVLGGGLLLVSRRLLYIPRDTLLPVLALGAIGNAFSFICYVQAISLLGISLATLLTSTHPTWTALLAWRFLGEPITRWRVVAIVGALAGCALIARVYEPAALSGSLPGIAFGLTSGITYGMYNTFAKRSVARAHPLAVAAGAVGVAAVVLLPLQPAPLPTTLSGAGWLWLLAFALSNVVLAPVVFNIGLKDLTAGMVSVLASWELVVALLVGLVVLGESMSSPQAVGAVLVAASITLLQFAPGPDRTLALEQPASSVA